MSGCLCFFTSVHTSNSDLRVVSRVLALNGCLRRIESFYRIDISNDKDLLVFKFTLSHCILNKTSGVRSFGLVRLQILSRSQLNREFTSKAISIIMLLIIGLILAGVWFYKWLNANNDYFEKKGVKHIKKNFIENIKIMTSRDYSVGDLTEKMYKAFPDK